MNDYKIYRQARIRVRQKRRFFSHLMVWGVMSIFFILLNIFTSNVFWAIFPILVWGVFVALHGLRVFSDSFGEEWEQRQLEKEIEKLKSDSTDFDKETIPIDINKKYRRKWKDSDFV